MDASPPSDTSPVLLGRAGPPGRAAQAEANAKTAKEEHKAEKGRSCCVARQSVQVFGWEMDTGGGTTANVNA